MSNEKNCKWFNIGTIGLFVFYTISLLAFFFLGGVE